MKIRLSDDEIYEIKMPEEIGIQDFQGIVSKFNFLLKNFVKFNIGEIPNEKGEIVLNQTQNKTYKKHSKQKWLFLRDNRNAFIEILKTHYLKPISEFEIITKKYDLDLSKVDLCSDKFKALKELHNIKPEEVGLKGFPTQHTQVKHLRLNNQGENQNE